MAFDGFDFRDDGAGDLVGDDRGEGVGHPLCGHLILGRFVDGGLDVGIAVVTGLDACDLHPVSAGLLLAECDEYNGLRIKIDRQFFELFGTRGIDLFFRVNQEHVGQLQCHTLAGDLLLDGISVGGSDLRAWLSIGINDGDLAQPTNVNVVEKQSATVRR